MLRNSLVFRCVRIKTVMRGAVAMRPWRSVANSGGLRARGLNLRGHVVIPLIQKFLRTALLHP